MSGFSQIMLRWSSMSFLIQLRLPTWDGEILYRELTRCIIVIYWRRSRASWSTSQWLAQQYCEGSRIVSDILNNLAIKPKHGVNDNNAKYTFFSHISSALQGVERLSKITEINKIELESCLYFWATLSSLALKHIHGWRGCEYPVLWIQPETEVISRLVKSLAR